MTNPIQSTQWLPVLGAEGAHEHPAHNRVLQLFADVLEWRGNHHSTLMHHLIGQLRGADQILNQPHDENRWRNGLIHIGTEVGYASYLSRLMSMRTVAKADLIAHGFAYLSEQFLPSMDELEAMDRSSDPYIQLKARNARSIRTLVEIGALSVRACEWVAHQVGRFFDWKNEHIEYLHYVRDEWHAAIRNGTFSPNTPWHPRLTQEQWSTSSARGQSSSPPGSPPRQTDPEPSRHREIPQERRPVQIAPRQPARQPTVPPPSTSIQLSPTLDIPLDNPRAFQPGISGAIIQNGVPIGSFSGQLNVRHPTHSTVNGSIPMGGTGITVGASTTLNRPWHNLRATLTSPYGNVSISRRHPLSDVQVYVPVIPGLGVSHRINLKHPKRGWSQARISFGVPGMNFSFPLRKLIKPIETIFKKIFGGGGGDGSAGGPPFFLPDIYNNPISWAGYVRQEWSGLNPIDVMNRYNWISLTKQNLLHSLSILPSCARKINALALLNIAVALEKEIWQSGDLRDKVNLSEKITEIFQNAQRTFQAYSAWKEELNKTFEQIEVFQDGAVDRAQLLSDAIHNFNFTHYPWLSEVYNKYLWLFLNAANEVNATGHYVLSTMASDEAVEKQGLISLANLSNFQEWTRLTALKEQASLLYPKLQEIYTHHAYMDELVPFILCVVYLEAEVQQSQNRAALAQEVRAFFTEHQILLLNWCTFWTDWNKHCVQAEELYANVHQIMKELSGSADPLYHSYYALLGQLADYIKLARNGNAVAVNNVKFNNLLNFFNTSFQPRV